MNNDNIFILGWSNPLTADWFEGGILFYCMFFEALEPILKQTAGKYCVGDEVMAVLLHQI